MPSIIVSFFAVLGVILFYFSKDNITKAWWYFVIVFCISLFLATRGQYGIALVQFLSGMAMSLAYLFYSYFFKVDAENEKVKGVSWSVVLGITGFFVMLISVSYLLVISEGYLKFIDSDVTSYAINIGPEYARVFVAAAFMLLVLLLLIFVFMTNLEKRGSDV